MQVKFTAPDLLANISNQTKISKQMSMSIHGHSFDSVLSTLVNPVAKGGGNSVAPVTDSEVKTEEEPSPDQAERLEADQVSDEADTVAPEEPEWEEVEFISYQDLPELPRPTPDRAKLAWDSGGREKSLAPERLLIAPARTDQPPVSFAQMAVQHPLSALQIVADESARPQNGFADRSVTDDVPEPEVSRSAIPVRSTHNSPEHTPLAAMRVSDPTVSPGPEDTLAPPSALLASGNGSIPDEPQLGLGATPQLTTSAPLSGTVPAPMGETDRQSLSPATPTGPTAPLPRTTSDIGSYPQPSTQVGRADTDLPVASRSDTIAPPSKARTQITPASTPAEPQSASFSVAPSKEAGATDMKETPEPTDAPALADKLTSVSPSAPRHIALHAPAAARQVLHHMADMPLQAGEKIEITLSPEELGRVRLSATQTDHGVVLVVQAERPETLDLMRRHLPDLMQDLRDMGFGDVSYSDQGQSRSQQQAERGTTTQAEAQPEYAPQSVPETGLDLRL